MTGDEYPRDAPTVLMLRRWLAWQNTKYKFTGVQQRWLTVRAHIGAQVNGDVSAFYDAKVLRVLQAMEKQSSPTADADMTTALTIQDLLELEREMDFTIERDRVIFTMLCVAWWMAKRLGEMCPDKKGKCVLLKEHVKINKDTMVWTTHESKTQKKGGKKAKAFVTKVKQAPLVLRKICPKELMSQHLENVKDHEDGTPMFTMMLKGKRQPVTAEMACAWVEQKLNLAQSGRKAGRKMCRRGGVSFMSVLTNNDEKLIRYIGRWAEGSEYWKDYRSERGMEKAKEFIEEQDGAFTQLVLRMYPSMEKIVQK